MSVIITDSDREAIAKDWVDTLTDMIYDENDRSKPAEFCEFSDREFMFIHSKQDRIDNLNRDIEMFGKVMADVAQTRVDELQASDPDYWTDSYVKDVPYYGGTECRILYRTYLALLGYKSYAGYISAASMDFPSIAWRLWLIARSKVFSDYRYERGM
jgi:hypothetical protein